MKEVVIVGAKRTAIGKFLGSLKNEKPVDLGVAVVNDALRQAGVGPELVDEVACGMIFQAGHKGNPARQIQIKCGMPAEGYAYTVNQLCSSGMKALELTCQSIMLGKSDVAVVVGAEVMSKAAYIVPAGREGHRMGSGQIVDSMLNDGLVCAMEDYHMGITAENLAEKYEISRIEQDELALLSHERAASAIESGKFRDEITPYTVKTRKGDIVFTTDEHVRNGLTIENLSKMRPAFKKNGTVTAGNASGVNDGAAALVVMSKEKAEELGIKPLAKVVATANAGVEPKFMGIGPAYAIPKVLKYANLNPNEIGYYEINEAFASQFIACNRELKLDMDKVNVNGSGIGLGHPVGCTGTRIVVSAIYEMQRRNEQYGIASLCVGGGPSMATVLELVK